VRPGDDDLEDHRVVSDVPGLLLDIHVGKGAEQLLVVLADALAARPRLLPADVVEPGVLPPRGHDAVHVHVDLCLHVLLDQLEPGLDVDCHPVTRLLDGLWVPVGRGAILRSPARDVQPA
jgi:hypothetical protein